MQENNLAATAEADSFAEHARRAFTELVLDDGYPCVGARAAVNGGTWRFGGYDELGGFESAQALAADLATFAAALPHSASDYDTFIAAFRDPVGIDEREFEKRLWLQLRMLNEIDAASFGWDPTVSPDPADRQFSFSFAGRAFYVIGMHARSSREARQFPWPALVFNPHEQFERLRTDGKWKRMQQTIRARDIELQGSMNPMLSDFGESSEARQYSGRAVEADWQPPFSAAQTADHEHKVGRCPFHH